MSTASDQHRIQVVDASELDPIQQAALDDLFCDRAARVPDTDTAVPQGFNDLAVPERAFAVLAWAADDSLMFGMIGAVLNNTDPSLAVIEGRAPAVSSSVAFRPTATIADIPSPFGPLHARFPHIDRITLQVPLGDALTASCLGNLGCTLDSYLVMRRAARSPGPYPNGILTRAATVADTAQIVELHLQHFADQQGTTAFLSTTPPDTAAVAQAVNAAVTASDTLVVAQAGEEVIGVVQVSSFDVPRDGKVRRIPPGRAGAVEWLCVRPQYRRRGVGTALASAAAVILEQAGSDYVYAFHGANNPLSTPRFWRRLGFQPAWGTWELHVHHSPITVTS